MLAGLLENSNSFRFGYFLPSLSSSLWIGKVLQPLEVDLCLPHLGGARLTISLRFFSWSELFPHVESKHIEQGLTQLPLNCQPEPQASNKHFGENTFQLSPLLPVHLVSFGFDFEVWCQQRLVCRDDHLFICQMLVQSALQERCLAPWSHTSAGKQPDRCIQCLSIGMLWTLALVKFATEILRDGKLVPKFIWSLESTKWCWVRLYYGLLIQSTLHPL